MNITKLGPNETQNKPDSQSKAVIHELLSGPVSFFQGQSSNVTLLFVIFCKFLPHPHSPGAPQVNTVIQCLPGEVGLGCEALACFSLERAT